MKSDPLLALQAKAELELRRRQQRGMGLLDWTLKYRQMLKPGMPLDFTAHAYLVGLYDCQGKRVVVNKAAQMGASEYAVSYAVWSADQRNATVLYVFPTDIHVSDFSSARIGPALEASEYLTSLVVDGGEERSGANRVTLKRIGDRFMYLRGAKVGADGQAPQLKSIDADVLILDEVDEMDERAAAIAVKRLGHSSLAEERYISTPTYPGRGINAFWLQSDMREWFIPCPHCGHKQFLTIGHFVTEYDSLDRPINWHGKKDDRAYAACNKCSGEMDRLAMGEWVATAKSDMAGFHLTKLFSPLANPLDLIRNLQTTDETRRRETLNQDFGETYTPKGGQISDQVLDACRRSYLHGPTMDKRPVAGVDVGKVIHCVIRTPGYADQERKQLFAGVVESWDELGRTLRRFRVRTVVIDAAPEVTKAREFQRSYKGGRVWLAYYVNQAVGTKNVEPWRFDDKEQNVLLDRTRTLDNCFSLFYDKINTLPANARDIPDYYKQLKSQVRIVEDISGVPTAKYIEGGGADHYAHAESYCNVANHAPVVPMGIIVQGAAKGW